MFDGLEDALNSFVCHPKVRTVALGYNMMADEMWECRITHIEDQWSLPQEVLRRAHDPLDAYIEAREAFREAIRDSG